MLRKNFLKEKLESGKAVLGTWAVIPSVVTVDIIASAGLDFIIIDAEHGPITFETAQNMAIACESREVSPIMRVPTVDEADIQRALDIGMHGVQIPNIITKNDVETVVRFAKYPPLGNRGYSPFMRAGDYSLENATILTETANQNTLVAINIEGKEVIENINEILTIEALDILFIGLFDLSKALGIPGKVNDPIVLQRLSEMTKKINEAGKYAGTIATSSETMEQFLNMGLKYILYLVDCEMLRKTYRTTRKEFERFLNG